MEYRYDVGLDLGQASDFTALCVLERPKLSHVDSPSPAIAVRHLERYPLGTTYPEIVRKVIAMLKRAPLVGSCFSVDRTGVGRAVVDLFRETMAGQVSCRFVPITITGGNAVSASEGGISVPKKELVSTLQMLLQTRRLKIAESLPEADVLVRELENFRVRVSVSGHESFEAWRAGIHDDLVLAVAMAAWTSETSLGHERARLAEIERERRRRIGRR